jgi:hypothetical protein
LVPSESGEKITLGVTILLAFFVNSLVVSNYTPESASELPVIGVYYTFNIIMNAISLFGSVIILRLHFKKHSKTPVPRWIKSILLIRNNRIHYTEIPIKKSKDRYDANKNQNYTYKLYKLHKSNFIKSKEEKMKLKKNEETSKEWKLVNTRIEYIFLFINVVTIMTATVTLFGKYIFINHYNIKNYEKKCGCEYSFIKD